ncbi:MAG: GFA family protein [Steroidobacteraceae bacterium]
MTDHRGKCFCGAVEFSVSGEPAAMGYCHCESCRHWSASPVTAYTLWRSDALSVTKGADNIGSYTKTSNAVRKWCKTCGGHLFSDLTAVNLVDVFASMLPTLSFKPAVHVFYGEKVLSIKDGLPKMKDFPKEIGGSGIRLAE